MEYISLFIYLLAVDISILVTYIFWNRDQSQITTHQFDLSKEMEKLNYDNEVMKKLQLLYVEVEKYYCNNFAPVVKFADFKNGITELSLSNYEGSDFIASCVLQIEYIEDLFQDEIPRLKSEKLCKHRKMIINQILN